MIRQPELPGVTDEVRATSVLVLAPHPDDEVVGCGGLLATLAEAGAAIRILFLTDGAGGRGAEAVDTPAGYARRRREEAARAGAVLGIVGIEFLDLPDGELAAHLDAASSAIARAITMQRPQLLLVPSPLELTEDHRAAFAALHRVLSPLRRGDPLSVATEELQVLVYEVNRPAFPDLLVDVGSRIESLSTAMRHYASQEERHPYLNAALGLRRYRTLTLSPAVTAAEGYRRLTSADFRTHGLEGLVRRLGGSLERREVHAGPRISVVVRTRDRPALLSEAIASLAASSYRHLELVLVNDGGKPPELPVDLPFPLRQVDHREPRGRAAAANAGIAAATGDFVAFLDDDDRVEPAHFEVLAGLVDGTGARVAYSDAAVGIYELDPVHGWLEVERRLPYSRDFDPDLLLVDNYIPFNTLLVERHLLLAVGPVDESLPFFEDWELLVRLAQVAAFQHRAQVTCEYRHFRGGAQVFGESPRERGDFLAVKARVIERHFERLSPERLARVVTRLRDEEVASSERAASESRERRELARRAARFESDYHRLHGETVGLREERERLERVLEERQAELDRLFGEEKRLHAEVGRLFDVETALRREEAALRRELAARDESLRATYGEIERLGALIREMESTRAMRLHRWLHRSPARSEP